MSARVLLDNDVLIKCSCYRVLARLTGDQGHEAGLVGVLGAARYIVEDRLGRDGRVADANGALAEFRGFMDVAVVLEPTADEVTFATSIEEAAAQSGVDVDEGESLLCAVVVGRNAESLVTGDKRAVIGLQVIHGSIEDLTHLDYRVACLEQLISGLIDVLDADELRTLVCGEPQVDRALSVCFGCRSRSEESPRHGLSSYIEDLRRQAPTMLWPGIELTIPSVPSS